MFKDVRIASGDITKI